MERFDVPAVRRMLADAGPGEYEVLDVRQDREYAEMHLPGARLIPLGDLPARHAELDPDRPVLVYCRTGPRSMAAAKLLEGWDFSHVAILEGGIAAWEGGVAEGDPDSGMTRFPALEGVADVYTFGYGMERALRDFYAILEGRARTEEGRAEYRRLAGFEDKHMHLLYTLYARDAADPLSREDFGAQAASDVLEGGLAPDVYLRNHAGFGAEPGEALELAMSIEAQALDYYLRCARRVGAGRAAEAFRTLAREEQGHLRLLAGLYDRMA